MVQNEVNKNTNRNYMSNSILDKSIGMFLGLAVGDALGTTLEFQGPSLKLHTEMIGGGVFELDPGDWTDDTSMAVALADSLVEYGQYNPERILDNWCLWYKKGKFSSTNECFDIGNSTRKALDSYLNNPLELPRISNDSLGNGSLMRLAPIVLMSSNKKQAVDLSYKQSTLTHAKKAAVLTSYFGGLLFDASNNSDFDINRDLTICHSHLIGLDSANVSSSGYYKDTFDAALWAILNTNNFEDALIKAVNLGDDADTVGAVTGQLAGAIYGYKSIPERWLKPLAWKFKIIEYVVKLRIIAESSIIEEKHEIPEPKFNCVGCNKEISLYTAKVRCIECGMSIECSLGYYYKEKHEMMKDYLSDHIKKYGY